VIRIDKLRTMKNIFMTSRVYGAVCTVLLLTFSAETFAQSNYFNSSRNWAFNKKEVYFGISGTQFLGDLGGGDGPGRQLSPADMDIESTRYGVSAGYRFRFASRLATKTNINIAMMSGSDAYTKDPYRNSRNLQFRSMVVELSQQLEFIVWYSENIKPSKKGLGSFFNNSTQLYVFTGLGAFYYNPKAELNGEWIALRPLGTEGQNMSDGPKKYGPFSYSIPMGIGFKTSITPYWRIGIEVAVHKTFTDYLDDVSGRFYHDFAAQAQGADGAMSVALADRHIANPQWFGQGKRRGNPEENDAMVFFNLHMAYNLSYKKGPKRAKSGHGMKTKF